MESEWSLSRRLLDEPSSSHSTYGKPASLDLGGEVFLSHSGKDKDFVWFLYKELCRRNYYKIVFFDIESLPLATPVSMKNILEEARKSKLGVLVLTEDFFMRNPNPMRELEAFVASKVPLLPLFFKMSVDEFKEKSRRANWENRWRTWFAEKQLGTSSVEKKIKRWRDALEIVSTFSGLEYCKVATNQPEYIEKIVRKVTSIIPPAVSYCEEGVFGKDRLCQIVDDMYKECALKCSSVDYTTQVASTDVSDGLRKDSGCRMLDLVGLYGFAGLGKTTLCKCLCDFYFGKFHGRVCYIDLASDQGPSPEYSFIARMQRMLSSLTDYSNGELYSFDVNQVKNVLRKKLSSLKHPIFLAIDVNIGCANLESEAQEEADFYLGCEFRKGSKVFITSRSRDLLEKLTNLHRSISVVIDYMPAINLEEAQDIFVHKIGSLLHNSGISNADDEMNMCVQMCILDLGWNVNYYHPLMLKSLAASIRQDRDWKGKLARLRSEGLVDKIDALKKVFSVLDLTFATLSEEAQRLFLDLALFCYTRNGLFCRTRNGYKALAWIRRLYSHLHESRIQEIFLQLQDSCFIEKERQAPVKLLVDFCKYKVTQGDYAQYYEVVEGDAHWRDNIPRSIRYVSVSQCRYNHDREKTCLDLRDVEAVEVLHLVDNAARVEVLLSSTTSAHLRSLIVSVPPRTSVCFIIDINWPSSAVGQVGRRQGRPRCMRLHWLELEGNVCFKPLWHSGRILSRVASSVGFQALQRLVVTEAPVVTYLGSSVLGQLRNLEFLHLSRMPVVQSINVMTFSNLKGLTLDNLPCLRSIAGLDKSTGLESVHIWYCNQVRTLTIPGGSGCSICDCPSLRRVSLCTTRSSSASER